ncbi:MAG: rRNA maturation RNase YbeY [Gammaproteobacteria bacterium]
MSDGLSGAEITVQFATRKPAVPRAAELRAWAKAALAGHGTDNNDPVQLAIRIVGETEGTQLNEHWRGKQGPTNVLSFPVTDLEHIAPGLIGDIVICAPVVAHEAVAQGKDLSAHWAHMIIHGTLHLLGYDHIKADQAAEMERLETRILESLGYPDPY